MKRLVTGVVLTVVAAGCSGSDGSDEGGSGSFVEQLGLVPASVTEGGPDSGVQVALGDVDRATELAGVERPADLSDLDAVRNYLAALRGAPEIDVSAPTPEVAGLLPEVSQWSQVGPDFAEFDDELGWSLLDVSWFVEYQTAPGRFTVMGGDFDEGQLEAALGEPEGGYWQLGGEDQAMDLEERSAARPTGEALRLAYDDDRLMVSRSTPAIEDAIADGDVESLAHDPVLHDLAAALDDEAIYGGMLMAGGSFAVADTPAATDPQALEEIEGGVLPESFDGVAVGVGHEDDAPYAVFAYAHADEDAAEANAEALPGVLTEGSTFRYSRPWSDWFAVDDIRRDGTTVVARLTLAEDVPPLTVYDVGYTRDALVLHR